jgi:predicted acylesterase/phospholipase RssA
MMGPPMASTDIPHRAPQRMKTSLPGRIVLVMQGGGAPGSYQAGAYQALHEAGIEPDWVIGTSIGAINGAIITGNKVVDRVKRLEEFWAQLDSRVPEPWSQLAPVLVGVPGFYQINPALAWGANARVGIEQAAMYLVDPLKKLPPAIVDFDLVNSAKTRFTLGLTTVQTGQIRYFDNKKERIGLEHVLGSSALPPSFPAVLIDGEYYWDGGVYSNSPIEVVFDEEPRQSSVVFAIQIWHTRGPRPESLSHVHARKGHLVWNALQNPHHAASAASSDAAHHPRTGRHASGGAQELAARQGARRLELHDDYASGGDQCTAHRRRDQRQRLRFFAPGSASPLAGGLRRYLPDVGAAAMG